MLVSANYQDDNIGLTRDPYCFLNSLGVQSRIAEHDFVGVPVRIAFGDLATQRVKNLRAGPDLVADTLQNTDSASRIVAVTAQMKFGGVRADDGDVLVLRLDRKSVV